MELTKEAADIALKAIDFDKRNCIDAAVYFYHEASRLLRRASKQLDETLCDELLKKAKEYDERAEVIQKPSEKREFQNKELINLNKCRFLFRQALDADESKNESVAVDLYTQAIQLAMQARTETDDSELKNKLSIIMLEALERAEILKGIKNTPDVQRAGISPILPKKDHAPRTFQRTDSQQLRVSGKMTYTEEEKKVLLATSRINKHEFVPFMDIDLNERFQYAIPFTDKDGPLALSPKQRREFHRWARPEEICSEPVLISGERVDCFSIKQTIVSDCSFVASLAVGALYEMRFHKRLITKIIYPRKKNKEPLFNPFGKYMVKLHLNGVTRKVIIDDTLPVNKYNQLLSSFSTKRNEMWISLLEKAYMKVMGGYDFPGSNSNIDLHALTGWIPERVAIRVKDAAFNSDSLFKTLLTRLHRGDVLATVATGEMSDEEAERAGLIPTHAYAVLDVRLINDKKLLQLKNPWSHVRWRGNYSELDSLHWTKEMCSALNYDPKSAASFDNGVFWIDYNSILNFFDVFYLNWNPALFTHTFCLHQSWSAGVGPAKDTFNISDNPQFRLQVGDGKGAVWILLTRHIVDIEDFKYNREYITMLVYKNKGKRVYYPHDPPPYLDGVRINSPHYLTKIILADTPERDFTLVLSQYEKTVTIYYTLRAYATCPFTLEKIADPFRHIKKIDGEWKGISAGGCANNHLTYPNNPRYRLNIVSYSHLCIDLKAPRQYQIGFDFIPLVTDNYSRKSTGDFRSGFAVLDLENVPPGDYDIVPSTYLPNQESKFFLTFKSSVSTEICRIK